MLTSRSFIMMMLAKLFPFLSLVSVALASSIDATAAVYTGYTNNVDAGSSSKTLEGVALPDTKTLDNGVTLVRNGEGVRLFNFLGMNVRIYVAGFWTAKKLSNPDDVYECEHPKIFDFTFLRTVGQSRVTAAWERQLGASVTYTYQGYKEDHDSFLSMFGPIESGGTESVVMIGDDTHIVDQGEPKGIIPGKNFQKAFLSMWFGEQAVADDLKSGLLGGRAEQEIMA